MKNIKFLFIVLLMISSCTKSVDESTLIEKDGLMYQLGSEKPYSGEVFDLYDSGENFYTGTFEQGKIVGDFVYYRKDGSIQEPLYYNDLVEKDGLTYSPTSDEPFSGEVVGLYRTGEKVLSGVFMSGNQVGDYTYLKKDGSNQEPLNYKDIVIKDELIYPPNSNELFSGEVIGYNDVGNKVFSGIFQYGRKVVDFSFFNDSGQNKSDINIINLEEIDGLLVLQSSGLPFSGKVYYNHPTGPDRLKEINYFNGKPLWGKVFYFKENGEIIRNFDLSELNYNYSSGNYYQVDSKKPNSGITSCGVISKFFPTGEPLFRGVIYNGKWMEGPTYFNLDGTINKPLNYPNQLDVSMGYNEYVIKSTNSRYTGLVYLTHPNGKKKMEGLSIQGKKEGIWTTWYQNGKKETEGKYFKGTKTGDWGYYYEDTGGIEMEGRSIDGKEQGLWKYYDKNSIPTKSIHWLLGVKHGKQTGSESGNYDHGVRVGEWRIDTWDKIEIGMYTDGEKYGWWEMYNPINGEFVMRYFYYMGEVGK